MVIKILLVILFTLLFDFVWIFSVMKREYKNMLGTINVNIYYTILSYTTIVLPIILFSLPNIRREHILKESLFYGGVLGALMYGMFSFTNLALLPNWTLRVGLLDFVWGFVLYTLVCLCTTLLVK